jgi:endonuclease IV
MILYFLLPRNIIVYYHEVHTTMTTINVINKNLKFGISCHISDLLSPKFRKFLLQRPYIQALSIYLVSDNGFSATKLTHDDINSINDFIKNDCFNMYTCIHSCLRYNLAGAVKLTNDPKYKSKRDYVLRSLPEELDYGVVLNSPVIVHLGVCEYREQGLKLVSHHITTCLTKISSISFQIAKFLNIPQSELFRRRQIVLENSAYEKNDLGVSCDEILSIINEIDVKYYPQISLCIDTCHTHASGMADMSKSDDVEKLFDDLREYKCKINVIHLNDSKNKYCCHKDRHEVLGNGHIYSSEEGKDALCTLLKIAESSKIPVISETSNFEEDWEYIKQCYPGVYLH